MEKSVKGHKSVCSVFSSVEIKVFCYLYLRVSGNLAHTEDFSSFNSTIVSFSVSTTNLGLIKLYSCIVSFQLLSLKV